jgi:hypothetical protein
VAQLVAHLHGVQGVGSSSLLVPTKDAFRDGCPSGMQTVANGCMLKGCTGRLHAVSIRPPLGDGVSKAQPQRVVGKLVIRLIWDQETADSSSAYPTVLEVGVGVLRQIVALVSGGSIPLKHLNDEKRLFSMKNVYY